jgi:hypothetical protein
MGKLSKFKLNDKVQLVRDTKVYDFKGVVQLHKGAQGWVAGFMQWEPDGDQIPMVVFGEELHSPLADRTLEIIPHGECIICEACVEHLAHRNYSEYEACCGLRLNQSVVAAQDSDFCLGDEYIRYTKCYTVVQTADGYNVKNNFTGFLFFISGNDTLHELEKRMSNWDFVLPPTIISIN